MILITMKGFSLVGLVITIAAVAILFVALSRFYFPSAGTIQKDAGALQRARDAQELLKQQTAPQQEGINSLGQ